MKFFRVFIVSVASVCDQGVVEIIDSNKDTHHVTYIEVGKNGQRKEENEGSEDENEPKEAEEEKTPEAKREEEGKFYKWQ